MEIEVLAPGLLTTVQDAHGRPGWERFGVPIGGALDPFAAEAANRLVGNQADDAVLEITLAGPTLRFGGPATFAIVGADLAAALDGESVALELSWLARPGALLTFGEARAGVRAYLAVAGGIQVSPVLNSRSTDLRGVFGGLDGRALARGDRLVAPDIPDAAARVGRTLARSLDRSLGDEPIRVLPGPHLDRFRPDALDHLCAAEWRVDERADRMGFRLEGPALAHRAGADVASLGLPVGAIQVPGDGRPIVLLADHQPTGGYAVLACAIRADLGLLAQLGPGSPVRFTPTTLAEARAALRAQQATVRAIQSDDAIWDALRRAE